MVTNNQKSFLALVRAGLWEKGNVNVDLLETSGTSEQARANLNFDGVDWDELYQLAEVQSVVGLVAAGIDSLNLDVPLELKLQIIGEALQIEQQNKEMNAFIADTVEKMREEDIYTLLVKGQGIAQCYERPLWRTSGDIDFFLSDTNYEKAKKFFVPLSSVGKPERKFSKEWGLNVGSWYVELHGTQRTGLSTRLDKVIDEVQRTVFDLDVDVNDNLNLDVDLNANLNGGRQRIWRNGETDVMLPGADEDVFLVFTHFIKHFYKEGGVSIRQLCDWCRLMWTYRESLNHGLLESRIRKAGLMSEWRAFAALAVEYFGMPKEAMPLFDLNADLDLNKKKAEKILAFILKGGEWHRWKDTMAVARIFPVNTFKYLPGILLSVTWLKVKERVVKP